LGPAAAPDLAAAFAAAVAAGALAASLLLLAAIAALRALRRWRQWSLARHEGAWRDALHAALDDPATPRLPAIGALEWPAFLSLWNRLQESARGEAPEKLAVLLRRHGLDDRALRLLARGNAELRLIAITALGHLREERAWPRLYALARACGPVVSFAAARALLRIDARRALDALGPSIVARQDWPLARLGTVFQELGPAMVTPTLLQLLVARPRHGLDRLMKLARFGHRHRVAPVIRAWLSSTREAAVVAAALDYIEDPEDLPWAREAASHEDWYVRMAAARALGRAGARAELAPLLDLVRDPVWWVRYHAAHALLRLQGLEPREVEELRLGLRDAYAADMLAQALAERGRR
jgi:HEAT repeat protein